MENKKKKNIVILSILFLSVVSILGYSFVRNKTDESPTTESVKAEELNDSVLVVDESGSITLGEQYDQVIINVPGVQIESGKVNSILVNDTVGDGDVTLLDIQSKELVLQGGGPNSIMIAGTSEIDSVFVERQNGPLAVRVQDESIIENVRVLKRSQDVTLEGDFKNIEVEASNIQLDIQSAIIETFSLVGSGVTVSLDENSKINSAIVLAHAEDNELILNGDVESVIVDGKDNSIDLNGSVGTVYIRDGADNVVLTLGNTSIVDSLITSVPLVLNGEGEVNKIVSDSDSDITGTFLSKKIADSADTKATPGKRSNPNPSTPRATRVQTHVPLLAGVQKIERPNILGGKSEIIKPNQPFKKPESPSAKPNPKPTPLPEKPAVKPDTPEDPPGEIEIDPHLTAKEVLVTNLDHLYTTIKNPSMGMIGGDWAILSLARGNYNIPENYANQYYENVLTEVNKLKEKHNGKLDRNKGSEHSRLILSLGALGYDVTNLEGYDLRDGIADFSFATRQGINGPIFALIAFDSHNYEIPQTEKTENQSTRERFINYILEREITQESGMTGGWALHGNEPNADITGMAIQGLTPYYEEKPEVKAAIDRAVDWLSKEQNKNGGYSSGWEGETLESSAQVVVALTGLGIDPHTDSRFIKKGNSVLDNLLSYALPDGGFAHSKPIRQADAMATEQGTYALVAYDRFVNKQNGLYNMSDVSVIKDQRASIQLHIVPHLQHTQAETEEETDAEAIKQTQENINNPRNEKETTEEEQPVITEANQLAEKLIKQKQELKTELKEYKNIANYTENIEELKQAISEGETLIEEATTFAEASEAMKIAKIKLDSILSDEEIERDRQEEIAEIEVSE